MMIAVVSPKLVSWLTPLWLIASGMLLGLFVLLALWGVLFLISRRAAAAIPEIIGEGVLLPLLWVASLSALFSIPGLLVVRHPLGMLESVLRLTQGGERTLQETIPAASLDSATGPAKHRVRVQFRGDELQQLTIQSDALVRISDAETEEQARSEPLDVDPENPYSWKKTQTSQRAFAGDYIDSFYVTNLTNRSAKLTIMLESGPAYPQSAAIPITAIGLVATFLLYLGHRALLPKLSAVALATTKSELAQPLFFILMALGAVLLILFVFIPYNTFGEDIKVLKISGLTLIMVLGIVQGVWGASTSVADEVEGRTALTVLSKPIDRRQFVLGKFVGIFWTVALIFIILGLLLLIVTAYKPVYDAREMTMELPTWEECYREVAHTVAPLALGFLQAMVLAAISIAMSTRLPLLANFTICFSVYVLGNLVPLIVQSEVTFPPVVFVGQFFAIFLPVLEHFSSDPAVAGSRLVPLAILGVATLYAILYSTVALLLAFFLFEDRDLA